MHGPGNLGVVSKAQKGITVVESWGSNVTLAQGGKAGL